MPSNFQIGHLQPEFGTKKIGFYSATPTMFHWKYKEHLKNSSKGAPAPLRLDLLYSPTMKFQISDTEKCLEKLRELQALKTDTDFVDY